MDITCRSMVLQANPISWAMLGLEYPLDTCPQTSISRGVKLYICFGLRCAVIYSPSVIGIIAYISAIKDANTDIPIGITSSPYMPLLSW